MINRGHIALVLAAASMAISVPVAATDDDLREMRRAVRKKRDEAKQHSHSREIARRLRQEARLAAKRQHQSADALCPNDDTEGAML